MNLELTGRERTAIRWTILALPVIAIIVAAILVGAVVSQFFSILVMFFLAWLLAFLLDPIVTRLTDRISILPRGGAATLVFIVVAIIAIALLVAIASSVISSLISIIGTTPTVEGALQKLLGPLQAQIDTLGLQVDLSAALTDALGQLRASASDLLGTVLNSGVILFTQGTSIIFIAIIMVASKGRFLKFLRRLIPDDRQDLYNQFIAATTRSFGGFIRGQFGLAGLYGLIVGLIAFLFGVPFVALTMVVTAALQSIPYFGQLVSWIPLVATTFIFKPDVLLPVVIILAVLLLIVQNFISPRVLGSAVGLNPILVLAAVFVGAQVAGAVGAVFGVPVAAVGATLFNEWLDRVRPEREVPEEPGEEVDQAPGSAPGGTAEADPQPESPPSAVEVASG